MFPAPDTLVNIHLRQPDGTITDKFATVLAATSMEGLHGANGEPTLSTVEVDPKEIGKFIATPDWTKGLIRRSAVRHRSHESFQTGAEAQAWSYIGEAEAEFDEPTEDVHTASASLAEDGASLSNSAAIPPLESEGTNEAEQTPVPQRVADPNAAKASARRGSSPAKASQETPAPAEAIAN